jgi:hypothetical protein
VSARAVYDWNRAVEVGISFDALTYGPTEAMVTTIGGPMTTGDFAAIERTAVAEVAAAFAGLRLRVSGRREAQYRVRVVQDLHHPMAWNYPGPAAESRGIAGLGGQAAVSFRMAVGNAIAYATDSTTREEMIDAIGRGIGRAAVHELAHMLLPHVQLHDSNDSASYEYGSAYRREQYYGSMHWDFAGPLLKQRFAGPRT